MQSAIQKAATELAEQQISFILQEPMKRHTSFRIGGPADIFCTPASLEQLQLAMNIALKNQVRWMPLGKGSNVLFSDEGYRGMVVLLGKEYGAVSAEGNRVIAQAGADLADVCRAARQAGLAGLEFAFGIPGSLGGAVYMNAGAFDGEMCDVLETVSYLRVDGEVVSAPPEAFDFGYRQSAFQKNSNIILQATFALKKGDVTEVERLMQGYMQRRIANQPLEFPSAGSAFKRPQGAYAGQLIDECGLRGFRVGDAAVSEKHCGFIVNLGQATAADVVQLADTVAAIVKEKTGYLLEKEIRVIT